MTKEQKRDAVTISAFLMLFFGCVITLVGLFVPPLGEIHNSVLWAFAQCLLYCGSALGIGAYTHTKLSEIDATLKRHTQEKPPPDKGEA